MTATTTAASAPSARAFVPLPWNALYEFGRHLCIGCMVIFGPLPVRRLKHITKTKNDALQIRLVVIKEGQETAPLTRELPRSAIHPDALAARIADAIAEAAAIRGN